MVDTVEKERNPERISWRIHERDLCRLSDAYKKAIYILIIALIIVSSFAAYEAYLRNKEMQRWLVYLEQYDFESYEYTQDGQGLNIIGDRNGVDMNVSAREGQEENYPEPTDGERPSTEKGQEMSSEKE